MFKRNKAPPRSSTPTTPKIKSIALPSFGGRGYESDSFTKSTSPLKRTAAADKQAKTAASRMKDVFPPPNKSSPLTQDASTTGNKPPKIRTRSDSITSVASQSGSTSWGGSSTTEQMGIDAPWASSQSSSSSWGGSSTSERKARSFDDSRLFKASCDGYRTRKSSFTGSSHSSTTTGGVTSKSKLMEVNVTMVPMKQETPTSVHWQLIPYCLRKNLGHPPLHFDLASDMNGNNDNVCFDNVYPRRPLSPKELNKTACDVEQMILRCDDLPKWAKWHVVVNCSKDNLIRCGDVFKEIHKTFNQPMSAGEITCIPSSEKRACERSFESRCERCAGLTAWNKKQGMKRVDYLRGKTLFNGLTFDQDQSIWVLHLTRSL